VQALRGEAGAAIDRLRRTVAIMERRGYAVSPEHLGAVCLGGSMTEADVLAAVEAAPDLQLREGLVLSPALAPKAAAIAGRAASHRENAARYRAITLDFVRRLVRVCPFVRGVAVAGSLASGGFLVSDDVDLNLIVEDGCRHLAYVALNVLGIVHALRYRGKPVDDLSRRPLAPRFMTANLILERRQCFPLARQDEDMAYELLASEPVHGVALWHQLAASNLALLEHFPQLAERRCGPEPRVRVTVPGWLFPAALDRPARTIGRTAWRLMQWTRRDSPEALARVAFVRGTMRPYALFDDG
jgi:hypothetical protein